MVGYTAFIDESGDDGFNFESGSSDFIVIAAIVTRTSRLSQFDEAIAEARVSARKSSGWVFQTFKKLNTAPVQRWLLASSFAALRIQACCVLVYKRGLTEKRWEENKEDIYFHASKFLLERVSWACRDTDKRQAEDDPRCRIVFSKRGGLRYENLQSYMTRLRDDPKRYGTKAEWGYLDPALVEWEDHSNQSATHLAADHFASAIGCAVESKEFGCFDDRYARLWFPRIYSYNNKVLGNGLKIWPEAGEDFLRSDQKGFWIFGRNVRV